MNIIKKGSHVYTIFGVKIILKGFLSTCGIVCEHSNASARKKIADCSHIFLTYFLTNQNLQFMFNSKFSLSDLKESNINQLVAADIMMIRGGKSGRCGGSNKSTSRSSIKKGSKKRSGGFGCMGQVTMVTTPVVAVDAA